MEGKTDCWDRMMHSWVLEGERIDLWGKESRGPLHSCHKLSFPGGSVGKESTCNARDLDSVPGSGRFPGEGNGKPFQYSCLGNSTDRGA